MSQVEEDYAKGKMKVGEGAAEGDGDEMKEGENTQVVGAKHSTGHQRGSQGAKMSVRNLRIREDTAKYLINLDPGSAFYDPKTRSMRANPYAGTGKEGEPDRRLTACLLGSLLTPTALLLQGMTCTWAITSSA